AVVVIENVFAPVGEKKIEVAVVIVVADTTSLTPSGPCYAGARGHIGKGAVMVIVVEMSGGSLILGESFDGGTVRQENVGPAIVVIVENHSAVARGFDDELFM